MNIAAADWETLQRLATRVGLGEQKVSALRHRLQAQPTRKGSPYTLILGRPDAGIELLFARWAGADISEQLLAAFPKPLVLGPTPAEIPPRLAPWATGLLNSTPSGHIIALRTRDPITPDTIAQLSSLGWVDELILVTRLGQPLHQQEREHAKQLAGIATTVKVLIVGIPGEEPSPDDIAEVTAFSAAQMRHCGFDDGRFLGAGVWFSGGPPYPNTIEDVGRFLQVDPNDTNAGHAGMARHAIGLLLSELLTKAQSVPADPEPPIDENERERILRDLNIYLTSLGNSVSQRAQQRRSLPTNAIQSLALDMIRGWGAHLSVEGHWLKYVDRLRPGTQDAFLAQAQRDIHLIESTPADLQGLSPPNRIAALLLNEASRLAVASGLGLATYLVVRPLLISLGQMPHTLATLISSVLMLIAAALGYGLAVRLLPAVRTASPVSSEPTTASLLGWDQFQSRLTAWLNDHLRRQSDTPVEQCLALATRLDMQDLIHDIPRS